MELLFNQERSHSVTLPEAYTPSELEAFPRVLSSSEDIPQNQEKQPVNVRYLIHWVRHFLLGEGQNADLFMQGDTV